MAVGIVGRPELLFLDEPTAGFDPQARRDFHDLVHRLSDLEDTTILLTTHDLDEAEQLADRILILADGPDRRRRQRRPARPAQVAGQAEVRWSRGRRALRARHPGRRPAFVRELFAQYGDERRRPGGPPGQPGGHLPGHGATVHEQGRPPGGERLMQPTVHAARLGLSRGWTELRQYLTAPQELGWNLFFVTVFGVVLFFHAQRHRRGLDLPWPC